jgi:hypothetical protein
MYVPWEQDQLALPPQESAEEEYITTMSGTQMLYYVGLCHVQRFLYPNQCVCLCACVFQHVCVFVCIREVSSFTGF